MPSWDELLGRGSIAETLLVWGLLNQLIQELLGPFLETITEKVNDANPVFPNSPADLADMKVRGVLGEDAAAAEARLSGVNRERFDRLVHLAGEPIGLEQVLEAYRRGFIGFDDTGLDTPSVERAVKTARYYDYWTEVIKQLAEIPISVGEAVDAALRGQIPVEQAKAEAFANGITAERFQILLDTAGRPPAPVELAKLHHRGLIPAEGTGPEALTFQQGIYEGDSKNKWWELLLAGEDYLPPPRTITALLKTGSLTVEQAQRFFADAGMSPELVAAYVHNAKGEKLAGTRQLAESVVLTLYQDRAIDRPTALAHLAALGYDQTDANLVVGLTDLQRELRAVNSAITRIGTLYISHKITRQGASSGLAALDVAADHAATLLADWDTEAALNVKLLTPAQIVDAWDYQIITQDEAQAELQAIGYTPRDAWILISNKAKQAQGNPPPQGPATPGTIP